MLVLIGNSPSSGSTFLADLLDSIEGCFCGPELSIFANPTIFSDYARYQSKTNKEFSPLSIYKTTNRPYYHNLRFYGLQKSNYNQFVNSANNCSDFIAKLKSSIEKFHNQEIKILFEKSPENIASVEEYLNNYPDGYFIHIVRNPIYVYKSLIKRNFSKNIALFTWYFDVLQQINFLNHPRVIQVKYEELTNSPADVLNHIFEKIGLNKKFTQNEIESLLANNSNRKQIKRVKSWTSKPGQISNANNKPISAVEKEFFYQALLYKISPKLANHFNVPQLSYGELIKKMGYEKDINELYKNADISFKSISFTIPEKVNFVNKGIKAFSLKNIKLNQLKIFTQPVVKV